MIYIFLNIIQVCAIFSNVIGANIFSGKQVSCPQKRLLCYKFYIAGCISFIIFGFFTVPFGWSLIIVNLVFLYFNIRGIINVKKEIKVSKVKKESNINSIGVIKNENN